MATSSKTMTLRSSDGEELLVQAETIVAASVLIRNMLEGDPAADVIMLPKVTGRVLVLVLVVDFCNRHYAAIAYAINTDLKRFDAEFMGSVDKDMLMGLLLAANYLEMQGY